MNILLKVFRKIIFIIALCSLVEPVSGQNYTVKIAPSKTNQEDEQMASFILPDVTVWGRYETAGKKERRKLDRTVIAVKKTYPFSQEIKSILVETYLYLQTLPDDESKEKHMKKVEKGVWNQYLPEMKKLTLYQGKMLIKLIDRECNQTSYELIKAFLGPFRSNFYQMFAGLFGASLKKEFDPENNKEDAVIEEIIELIENGYL